MRRIAAALLLAAACCSPQGSAAPGDRLPAGAGTITTTAAAASRPPAPARIDDGGTPMTTSAAPGGAQANDEEMPAVVIEAARRYLRGLPMLVAVTYENRSKESEFYDLPELGPLATNGELAVRLEPLRGGAPVETRFTPYEDPRGLTLLPGQSSRRLADLSNLGVRFEPGSYRLTLTLRRSRQARSSNPVDIEIAAPPDADAAEAARLRKMGEAPVDTGAWAPFLRSNWNTVTVSPSLGAEAKQQLALHVFLHRAAYGPEPVAAIDPAPLAAITEPSLLGEVAALRYELLAARRDPGAQVARAAMLKAYPGLAGRAEAVDRGEGEIAALRRSVGAEKRHIKPPAMRPYVP